MNAYMNHIMKEIEDEASLTLLVGPEGGWSSDEVDIFQKNANVLGVSLGSRILRLETVTPVIAFMVMN